jgi:hypothetical protein
MTEWKPKSGEKEWYRKAVSNWKELRKVKNKFARKGCKFMRKKILRVRRKCKSLVNFNCV